MPVVLPGPLATIHPMPLEPWVELLIRTGLTVLAGVLAYLALRWAAGMAARSILARDSPDPAALDVSALERAKRVGTLEALAVRAAGVVIVLVVGLMVLSSVDVDIGPAIAGLGIAGIAIGFGAQTLVKDLLAGIFILAENQFSRGDVVRIAGVAGAVEDFSLRRTVLRDLDGTVHTVPNGEIAVASNLTRLWGRVNLDVQVAYETDLEQAVGVLNRLGAEMADDPEWGPRIIEAPTVLRVDELGESGITLKVLGMVQAAQQWAVAGELRLRILAAFAESKIEIPYPHRAIVRRNDKAPGQD
jgi:moderate conductance mechanosensitive channel